MTLTSFFSRLLQSNKIYYEIIFTAPTTNAKNINLGHVDKNMVDKWSTVNLQQPVEFSNQQLIHFIFFYDSIQPVDFKSHSWFKVSTVDFKYQ